MMIQNVLKDANFPKEMINIVQGLFEHIDERDLMNGGYPQVGKEISEGFRKGTFFGQGDIVCNTYPGIPCNSLTELFIGLSFDTKRLTNLLAAYTEFLSAHCNAGTKSSIYAVLITDKWSDSDYKKYKTLINNLSGVLKVNAVVFLVLEHDIIHIPVRL